MTQEHVMPDEAENKGEVTLSGFVDKLLQNIPQTDGEGRNLIPQKLIDSVRNSRELEKDTLRKVGNDWWDSTSTENGLIKDYLDKLVSSDKHDKFADFTGSRQLIYGVLSRRAYLSGDDLLLAIEELIKDNYRYYKNANEQNPSVRSFARFYKGCVDNLEIDLEGDSPTDKVAKDNGGESLPVQQEPPLNQLQKGILDHANGLKNLAILGYPANQIIETVENLQNDGKYAVVTRVAKLLLEGRGTQAGAQDGQKVAIQDFERKIVPLIREMTGLPSNGEKMSAEEATRVVESMFSNFVGGGIRIDELQQIYREHATSLLQNPNLSDNDLLVLLALPQGVRDLDLLSLGEIKEQGLQSLIAKTKAALPEVYNPAQVVSQPEKASQPSAEFVPNSLYSESQQKLAKSLWEASAMLPDASLRGYVQKELGKMNDREMMMGPDFSDIIYKSVEAISRKPLDADFLSEDRESYKEYIHSLSEALRSFVVAESVPGNNDENNRKMLKYISGLVFGRPDYGPKEMRDPKLYLFSPMALAIDDVIQGKAKPDDLLLVFSAPAILNDSAHPDMTRMFATLMREGIADFSIVADNHKTELWFPLFEKFYDGKLSERTNLAGGKFFNVHPVAILSLVEVYKTTPESNIKAAEENYINAAKQKILNNLDVTLVEAVLVFQREFAAWRKGSGRYISLTTEPESWKKVDKEIPGAALFPQMRGDKMLIGPGFLEDLNELKRRMVEKPDASGAQILGEMVIEKFWNSQDFGNLGDIFFMAGLSWHFSRFGDDLEALTRWVDEGIKSFEGRKN